MTKKKSAEVVHGEQVMSTLDQYLKSGKSHVASKDGHPLFQRHNDFSLTQIGNLVYSVLHDKPVSSQGKQSLVGVLVKSKKSGYKFAILTNGEMQDGIIDNVPSSETNVATFSPTCLTRLITNNRKSYVAKSNILDTWKKLASGEIELLDSTQEIRKDVNPKMLVEYRASSNIRKVEENAKRRKDYPGHGYTLINAAGYSIIWHKPASCLFSYKKNSYLIGQDEGTYFGCELVIECKTMKDAYACLMPPDIRKLKGVLRQGEWYFIPVNKKKLPEQSLRLEIDGGVILSRETDQDNMHEVCSYDMFVADDGKFYFYGHDAKVIHNQHNSPKFHRSTWYTVMKNTALMSVSQEGMD